MISKLYIIGNGFDLHHGLDTKYSSFARYIKKNNIELHSTLEGFFSYDSTENDLWSNFENNLANLDIEGILLDNDIFLPDIASESFRSRDMHAFPDVMQNILDLLTSGLRTSFANFIRSIKTPKSATEKMLEINTDAYFFTYNYTYLLEDLYKISPENILHIHHGAESRYCDIILGHGVNPSSFFDSEPEPPDHLSAEDIEKWYEEQNSHWDYSYDTGKNNIMQYFTESFKDTTKNIEENLSFFSKLKWIDSIFVLGHSLSHIDLPYIKIIKDSVANDAEWTVSFHSVSEIKSHLRNLMSIGINKKKIKLIKINEIQIKNRQLKIDFNENTSS